MNKIDYIKAHLFNQNNFIRKFFPQKKLSAACRFNSIIIFLKNKNNSHYVENSFISFLFFVYKYNFSF